jgi:RNA polymerase sigma-70 factor (ECF subfamily)
MENTGVYRFSSINTDKNNGFLLDLVAKAKQGQEEAFGSIYNLYFEKIYRFIYYRVSHKEIAEDLSEDVFLKAFSKLSSIQKDASFEGWLYQIARNKVIDYYRDKKQLVALEDVENTLEYETNIIDVLELKENQKIFLKILKELGTEQQLVIKLKFLENLENEQIAEIMHKNEGAIRVIQHRAIARLQELIKGYYGKI